MPFRSLSPRLRHFRRARAGNVGVLSAICFPVLLIGAVFAVDEGAIFNEQRTLQGLADLAAMSAAAHPDRAEDAVLMTLLDNGLSATLARPGLGDFDIPSATEATARVVGGRYEGSAALAPTRRFTPGAKPFNAFKVELEGRGTRYLGRGLMAAPTMRVAALGYAAPEAAFRVGSRLARLDGGIANAVLGALAGGNLTLTAMDYRALAEAQVDMLDFCDALALGLHLRAATYSQLLQSSVALPDFLETLAQMRGQDPVTASALRQAAHAADRRLSLPLGSLLDPGTAGAWPLGLRRGPIAASARVLDLVNAALGIARGGRQVEASLGAAVAGVFDASLNVAIGERAQDSPWMRIGERGETVRTAQTRLLLRLRLGGPGGTLGSIVNLPIYGELAFAEAMLADIACLPGKPAPTRVTLSARPGIAMLRIGEADASSMVDFRREPPGRPALLADARLVKVSGSSQVEMANTRADGLTFTAREIEAATAKTVSTRDTLTSPAASLIDGLELEMQAGPLAAGVPSGLGAELSRALRTSAEPVDKVLFSVLAALGLSLGEADVTVSGGTCNHAVLVQ